MPKNKPQRPAYKIVKKENDYHVYTNDGPDGSPTGRIARSFDEGQKIIAELEDRDKAGLGINSLKPAYKIVKKGNDYHVYTNDSPDGSPTGRRASSFDEGQKIITELENRDRACPSVPPRGRRQSVGVVC